MSITTGLTGSIVQAFSWMLIHSLWQGLLLSILAGMILMLTRKSGAAIRYNLVLALFAIFLFTVTATFFYEWNNVYTITPVQAVLTPAGSNQTNASTYFTIIHTDNTPTGNSLSHYNLKDFIKNFSDYFSAHCFLVVMLWFIFFIAKSVSMAGNILYMQRARHYRVYAPADHWKKKFESLCEKLQLKRAVLLLESGYVKVPVVIGHLKPVILVPVGLMAGIPAEQVEAVLLHELAHIRRNDYIVNFLQNITETVFFFNPGLLWISSLLKEERENCCDDIAIDQTNSKEDFVQALISFKAYSLNTPAHAIAFSGQKSTLLNRVMRIVYQENKTLSLKENGVFIIGIAMLALTAFTVYPAKELKSVKRHASVSKGNNLNLNPVLENPLNEDNTAHSRSTTKLLTLNPPANTIDLVKEFADKIGDELAIPMLQTQVAADKFDDSKFYSRTALDNGLDLIEFHLKGSRGKTTLHHNGKVAFIIKGVIHEESEMANFTESQISVFDTGASSIGTTRNAKARFPDLDLSKYEAYIAIGLDYKDMSKMADPKWKKWVDSLKFDNNKFYSRAVLYGGYNDIIRVHLIGTGIITLRHNLKVAFLINGVIHEESEVANFTKSQIDALNGRLTGVGELGEHAKNDFPNLDLSKYGALVTIGTDISKTKINNQPALNKDNGLNVKPNSTIDTLLRSMPGIKINADGTISNGNKTITGFNINGKHYTVDEIKAAIGTTKPDSSTNNKRGWEGGAGIRYGP